MNITMGAKCFDGDRRKTLPNVAGAKLTFSKGERVPAFADHNQMAFIDKAAAWCTSPKILAVCTYAVPLALLLSGLPPIGLSHAMAHTAVAFGPADAIPAMAAAGTQESIMHAFDPLIHLIKNLAYPIAGVMIAGGCLFIMVGNREAGMKMLTNAALGYVLVQLSPLLLKLLVGVGTGI